MTAANDNPSPETLRWKATVDYTGHGKRTVYFEEISELEAIIEGGPDWNLMVDCVVELNRRNEPGYMAN